MTALKRGSAGDVAAEAPPRRQRGVGRQTATGRVYELLKKEILTCTIPPGQALFEGDLAERLGVSKTPVREALGMLVQESFVEVRSHQGYKVADLTIADVHEVFQLRLLLEPAAAALAAEHATPEQLRTLRRLSKKTYDYSDRASYQGFMIDNRAFHVLLAEASGNRRLAATVRRLLEEMQRLYYIGLDLSDKLGAQAHDHRELVDAVIRKNSQLANDIAVHQVEASRKLVTEALLASLSAGNSPLRSAGRLGLDLGTARRR